jgi:hypothetical protein
MARESKYCPYPDPDDFTRLIKVKINAPQLLRKELSRVPVGVVGLGDYQPFVGAGFPCPVQRYGLRNPARASAPDVAPEHRTRLAARCIPMASPPVSSANNSCQLSPNRPSWAQCKKALLRRVVLPSVASRMIWQASSGGNPHESGQTRRPAISPTR